MVKIIRISREQYHQILSLRERHRSDCDAAFGTNESGEIWPWKRWGVHPEDQRFNLRGSSGVLDRVAGMYVELSRDIKRASGGRFFIAGDCAYWKDQRGDRHQILTWQFDEPKAKKTNFQIALSNLRNFRVSQNR
jgi:hypothetical protein